ncbi:MAG: hypothetical protein AB7G47_18695 [Mycolicibacterium sp.]|uniref:hypothetical protein n=1 Tax=Mycolicibacterium sp. TaxID=2320850 RepID=UPI003D096F5B
MRISDRNADIWEFGAVRRHVDGSRSRLHMFVEHDPVKAVRLPEPFHTDYTRRCPVNRDDLVPQRTAAIEIYEFIGGDPIVVGAVVTFDSHRLAVLFGRHRIPQPRWLYTVVDVCRQPYVNTRTPKSSPAFQSWANLDRNTVGRNQ